MQTKSQKVKMSSKNQTIIDLTLNGTVPKNIAKMLKKPLSTLYNVILYC